jgi:hypothetical protein
MREVSKSSAATHIYKRGSLGNRMQLEVAIVAIAALASTWALVLDAESQPNVRPTALLAVSFAWAFFPAVWAWLEFFFIHPKYGSEESAELLKEGHRVSLAIWAPLALSLAAYSSSDYFKPLPVNEPRVMSPAQERNLVPAAPAHEQKK